MRLFIFLNFCFLFFLFLTPQEGYDVFLAAKIGEHFLQKGFFTVDNFSYGETGARSFPSWIYSLLTYFLLSWGGLPLFLISKAFAVLLAVFFLYRWQQKRNVPDLGALFFASFAGIFNFYFFDGSPRHLSFLFFSFLIYYLEGKELDWRLFKLSFFFLIWRNCDSFFFLPPALFFLLFCYSFFLYLFPHFPWRGDKESNKPFYPFSLFLLCVLIFWLYPQGKEAFSFAYLKREIFISFFSSINQWRDFSLFHPHQIFYLFFVLLAFLALFFSHQRIEGFSFLLFVFFVFLPFFHQEYTYAAVAVISSLSSSFFVAILKKWQERISWAPPGASFLFYGLLLGLLLFYTYAFPFRKIFKTPLFPFSSYIAHTYPAQAASFILMNELPPRLAHEPQWGGYLLTRLYPLYQIGCDQRFGSFYKEGYLRDYLLALEGAGNWEEFMKKKKVNLVLLRKGKPLYERLAQSQNWVLIYEDTLAALFLKKSPKTSSFLQAYEENTLIYPEDREFQLAFARALGELGELPKAEFFYQRALKNSPDKEIYNEAGLLFLREQQGKKALAYFQQALAIDARYLPALINSALAYLKLHKKREAQRLYEKAKALAPEAQALSELKKLLDKNYLK